MWSMEVNKIFAAILAAVWLIWVVNFVGDLAIPMVQPDHQPEPVAKAGNPSVQAKKAPASPAKQAAKRATGGGLAVLIAAADVAEGRKLAKKCAACHTFKKGGKNRVGPNIWGVVDGPRGVAPGYRYSASMKALGGTWSYQDLDKFLAKPKVFLPKSKMAFAGMKKPPQRAALIKYLRTLSDKPPLLP